MGRKREDGRGAAMRGSMRCIGLNSICALGEGSGERGGERASCMSGGADEVARVAQQVARE